MKLIYSIHQYDVFMFTWLNNVRTHSILTRYARSISGTGDGFLYLLTALWAFLQQGSQSALFQVIVLAFAIERPVYYILKNSLKRNRPQAALKNFHSTITPSDQFSFPSGHTSAAFMMATLLVYFAPALTIPLFIWAGLVGFSRVILGVHFPTDTFMGAFLGAGTAILSLELII